MTEQERMEKAFEEWCARQVQLMVRTKGGCGDPLRAAFYAGIGYTITSPGGTPKAWISHCGNSSVYVMHFTMPQKNSFGAWVSSSYSVRVPKDTIIGAIGRKLQPGELFVVRRIT